MKRIATVLVSLVFLGALAVPSLASSLGSWPLIYEQNFGDGPTSLFVWDDDTIGMLDAVHSEITLFTFGDRDPVKIALSHDFHPQDSGQIFPDAVQRSEDGTVYWLNRRSRQVGVFSETGELLSSFETITAEPYWMQLEAGGFVRVLESKRGVANYCLYSIGGELIETSPTSGNLHQGFFFNMRDGAALEIPSTLPLEGLKEARLATALGVVDDFRQNDSPTVFGGFQTESGSVFLLGNGAKLVELGPTGVTSQRAIPPTSDYGAIPLMVTGTDRWVAALSHFPSGKVNVRVWETDASSGLTAGWTASQSVVITPEDCETEDHSCTSKNCEDEASCTGHFTMSTTCSIQCYKKVDGGPEIRRAGSADCGSLVSCPDPTTEDPTSTE